MKHKNNSSIFKNRLGLFIIILALVIILLLIFGFNGKDIETNENASINDSVNQEQEISEPVNVVADDKTELEKVVEKTLSEKGLCEDYNFNEGDSIELKNTQVTLEKVSSTSAKILADKEVIFLSPGDDEVINELRIELEEGNLHYFGAEDEDNLVVLRLGCKHSNEDPNEKYVRERGEDLCKEVYNQCRDSFGLD